MASKVAKSAHEAATSTISGAKDGFTSSLEGTRSIASDALRDVSRVASAVSKASAKDAPRMVCDATDTVREVAYEGRKADETGWTSDMWKPLCVVTIQLVAMNWCWSAEHRQMYDPFSTISLALPIVMTFVYVAGILYLKNSYMVNREPFQLKSYMVMYNLFQTLFNVWSVVSFLKEVFAENGPTFISGADKTPAGFNLGFLIWLHYNNKYIEMLDTVFMALRKKNNQITFLHMWHHTLILWAWWAVVRFECGGTSYFGALMNSGIHVMMYAYYLLALLKVRCPWKRHLTQAQLTQFVICLAHAVYAFTYTTEYPRWLISLQVFVMLNMLVFFAGFFYNARCQMVARGNSKAQ
ncbi:hypothetical protein, variant [Sphaeroforma arctica JP610]|uniref:Elongation of fatty acids protein n=1 Tax=Sphaeroforma arctica JP610 TaxID=667725 RepID=A0A0L0FTK6_9EUKA|nr:hypothetical protein, variant [Sphaeroforma arctica JP610]KNC80024.1 hypothetical protein, variant [Sphaeroforma arctica JP610]|eukprot:XP_014153926.1 hypothetical protein, variant [Sphaeroforma arctica JP610]